jgi:hypothetical protein
VKMRVRVSLYFLHLPHSPAFFFSFFFHVPNDVRVLEELHDVDLPLDHFQRVLVQFSLVDYFDGHLINVREGEGRSI